MIRTFTPRLDILPAAQRQVWPALSHASRLGFVLYGGTAIALRLGHRPSIDFDFFTDRTLNKGELYEAFPFLRRSPFFKKHPIPSRSYIQAHKLSNTSNYPSLDR